MFSLMGPGPACIVSSVASPRSISTAFIGFPQIANIPMHSSPPGHANNHDVVQNHWDVSALPRFASRITEVNNASVAAVHKRISVLVVSNVPEYKQMYRVLSYASEGAFSIVLAATSPSNNQVFARAEF